MRMMSTGEQSNDGKVIQTVLDVELSGDWKTYWRSPGEGGIPPSWDWSESSNIESVEWHWPIPKYYEQLGVMTLGYKKARQLPCDTDAKRSESTRAVSCQPDVPIVHDHLCASRLCDRVANRWPIIST